MKIKYYAIIEEVDEIDFDEIYNYIEDAINNSDTTVIYDEFMDNIEYYLNRIYDIEFQESENEWTVNRIDHEWYTYCVEKYGKEF